MASLVLVHHFIDTLTLVNLSSLYDPLHVHRTLIRRRLFEWQKMATGHPVVASSLTKQFGSLEQVCSSVKQVFGAPCTKPWRLTCYRSRRNRPATATSLRTTPPILRRWLAPPGPRPLSPTAISRYSIIHSFEKKNWIKCCVAKIQLIFFFFVSFWRSRTDPPAKNRTFCGTAVSICCTSSSRLIRSSRIRLTGLLCSRCRRCATMRTNRFVRTIRCRCAHAKAAAHRPASTARDGDTSVIDRTGNTSVTMSHGRSPPVDCYWIKM